MFDVLFDGQSAASANTMRQWAELAHWFPSLSGPAGLPLSGLASLTDPGNANATGQDDFSAYSNLVGHSYLLEQPYAAVFTAYGKLARHLRF